MRSCLLVSMLNIISHRVLSSQKIVTCSKFLSLVTQIHSLKRLVLVVNCIKQIAITSNRLPIWRIPFNSGFPFVDEIIVSEP